MLFILWMVVAIVNGVFCAIAGSVLVVGFVFFLIGLPEFKKTDKFNTFIVIQKVSPILLTLLSIVIYMVFTYWCTRTSGTLAFTRLVPGDVHDLEMARKLFFLSVAQGFYALVALKWMLPALIGELGLGKKHIWGITAGSIISIAGGGIAWLLVM